MQDADNLISVEILDLIKVENNYHVLLKNDQNDVLWIQIGNSEGIALEYALLKQLPPRPFAHTLFLNILKWSKTDFEIHRLTIHDLKDDTFLADLTLGIQSKTVDFDCRPSDGLFLALQYDAPIFVSADVMEKVKKDPEQIYQDMNPISEEEKEIMQQKIQEHTASVPIPFDSLRGRLVGKDGRNIRAFEAATGAVLIANRITPKEVLISSSDSETLDVAVSAMKQLATRLIISPEVVQEIVQTCKSETGSNS